MSIPNPTPHKTLYINDYICSCYAFVFIFEFSEYISKHILQFHTFFFIIPSIRSWLGKIGRCYAKFKGKC